MPADDVDATDAPDAAAKTVIEDRLVGLGITDYERYVDNNKDRIIVRFPWKTGEADFNPADRHRRDRHHRQDGVPQGLVRHG